MTPRIRAHLALISTTLIFGFAYNIVKALLPAAMTPMQLIFVRLLGSMIIFWAFQRLFVPEKVERKDLLKLAACGMFGFALNQALFYEGLNLTTPVDASLIHVLNPVAVMLLSSLLLSERITLRRAGGIALGASGAIILVLSGGPVNFSGNHTAGNLLILLNLVFYALYLVMLKPLIGKYHTTTILKWVSFFGFLFVVPFSIGPALEIVPSSLPASAWAGIAYIILLNTFLAYLLINYALKHVGPTSVSYYSYLQPVIASATSVTVGQGAITLPKVAAALLIFAGVYLVNRTRLKEVPEGK